MTSLGIYLFYALLLNVALSRWGFRANPEAPKAAISASEVRPKRILVVGATGGTGRQLVSQALARGYAVTALVRNSQQLPRDLDARDGLSIHPGNVLDPASLAAAVRGQDAVVSALGHKRFFGPSSIQSRGTSNLLAAMASANVSRYVGLTSLGLGDTAGRMGIVFSFFTLPVILPFYFWDKARQERVIVASRAVWTIVRAGTLTNGTRTRKGDVRPGPAVGNYLLGARISRADVASFMLDQLETSENVGRAVGVA